MNRSSESGAGVVKLVPSLGALAMSVSGVMKLDDTGHAMLSTAVFVFFVVHVVTDMVFWRREVAAVWVVGPLTLLVAAYWWVGFLAMHRIPATPFLPAALYPPQWAYVLLFAWLALYCAWDIIDARMHAYRDERALVAGAVSLLTGAAVCLFLTLRGPQGV